MNSSSCWNVRASPRRARFDGDAPVTFWPARNTSPPCGSEQPGQHAEQRGLAGAVRADEPDDRRRRHRQAHVVEGDQPAEAHGHVAGLDARRRARRRRSRRARWPRSVLMTRPPPRSCRRVAVGSGGGGGVVLGAAADRGGPRYAVAAGTGTRATAEALCSSLWNPIAYWCTVPSGFCARAMAPRPKSRTGSCAHVALELAGTVWKNAGENVKRSPASSAAMFERTPNVTSTASQTRPSEGGVVERDRLLVRRARRARRRRRRRTRRGPTPASSSVMTLRPMVRDAFSLQRTALSARPVVDRRRFTMRMAKIANTARPR